MLADNLKENDNFLSIKLVPSQVFIYFMFIPFLLIYHINTIYEFSESLNSVFYFLPLLGVFMLLLYNFFTTDTKLQLNLSFIQLAIAYLTIVGVGMYFSDVEIYYPTFIRDIVIAVFPLLFFAFAWQFTERQFNWLFIAAILSYFIWIEFKFSPVFLSTILITSYSSVEYHFGCVAGLFVVYYLYKKNWLWFAISIGFIFFVNKRANLLGLFAAIPVYYLLVKPFKIYDKKMWLFVFLFAYFMFFWMIGTNMEYFGKLFLQLVGNEDIDLDYFLTGRMILINHLQPEILNRGLITYLFGNGPGQADVFLWKTLKDGTIYLWETRPYLVHNDFLKLQFDIGLIGAVLYFFVFYYLYAVSRLGVLVFLYAIPLFLIDNTVIYLYNILVGGIAARVFHKQTADEFDIFGPPLRFFRRG